jgi:hypothetical protein
MPHTWTVASSGSPDAARETNDHPSPERTTSSDLTGRPHRYDDHESDDRPSQNPPPSVCPDVSHAHGFPASEPGEENLGPFGR